MERPLADAGILRTDLDDPDARIPCTVWVPMFCRALEERPMKNAGMRLATVTPIGAFPLIDYLIVTSRNVGEGLERLARYLRIAEAPSIPSLQEGEDPIRVLFEGRATPMSAEFSVTLNVLHFREETEDRFRAAYASFSHTPDDVAEMERVLGCPVHTGASWNGWALSRETWQLPLRRRDPVLGGLLQRQADEALGRLPPMVGVALDVRRAPASRVGGGDTRIQAIARTLATSARSLQPAGCGRLFVSASAGSCAKGTPPSAICRTHRCRSVRSRTCLAILNPQRSTERSGDGIKKRHRRSVNADEMKPFVCPCNTVSALIPQPSRPSERRLCPRAGPHLERLRHHARKTRHSGRWQGQFQQQFWTEQSSGNSKPVVTLRFLAAVRWPSGKQHAAMAQRSELWRYRELASSHHAPVTMPEKVAELLIELSS